MKWMAFLILVLYSGTGMAQSDTYPGIWLSEDDNSYLVLYGGVAVAVAEEKVQQSGQFQYVRFKDKPDQLSIKWQGEYWATYLVRFPNENIMELQADEKDPARPLKEFSNPSRFKRAK